MTQKKTDPDSRSSKKDSEPCKPAAVGRKRDPGLDEKILQATIDALADLGFDGMTMDMVAARGKAGKAALYRRWPSKTMLVKDALIWMSRKHLLPGSLPDTGNLRDDLLALIKPQSIQEGQRKLQVLAGLGSFWKQEEIAETGVTEIFEPWAEANRQLIQRAIKRGEISDRAEVDQACKVISAMTSYRSLIERKTADRDFFVSLIDCVILPALLNPPADTAAKKKKNSESNRKGSS